jgi:hypothetical protein
VGTELALQDGLARRLVERLVAAAAIDDHVARLAIRTDEHAQVDGSLQARAPGVRRVAQLGLAQVVDLVHIEHHRCILAQHHRPGGRGTRRWRRDGAGRRCRQLDLDERHDHLDRWRWLKLHGNIGRRLVERPVHGEIDDPD